MDQILPWRELRKVIKPFYPKPKCAGRPPVGLEWMLRIHFLQHSFNLSDPAVEDAFYESRAMRCFVSITLSRSCRRYKRNGAAAKNEPKNDSSCSLSPAIIIQTNEGRSLAFSKTHSC